MRPASLAAALALAAAPSALLAADLPPRVAAPAPVFAPAPVAVGGLYFVSRTGISELDDTRFNLAGRAVQVDTEYEIGTFNTFGVGYSFGPVLGGLSPRVEIEGFYGDFSVDNHRINGVPVASVDSFGELRAYGGFGSLYLDLGFGQFGAVTPFIGAGVGGANVKLKKQGVSATGVVVDDEDTQIAYHVSAGVGIDLGRLGFGGALFNRSTLEIGYRFMQVPDLEFIARDGTRSETELTANMVTVGFRRQF